MNSVSSVHSGPEVYLNRVVTKVPPHDVHDKFLSIIPTMIADERERRLFGKLAAKAQIEHRYSVLPPSASPDELDTEDFYRPGRFASTAKRMQKFEEASKELAGQAAEELLARFPRERITHLIVTTCTGFFAPGLDLYLQKKLGLRSDLERSIIGFMGCYAAINGMKAAWHIVRSQPQAVVMMINLELCSLHLQENSSLDAWLGAMQFADGCAASLISAEAHGLKLDRFKCEVLADAADLIQWHVRDSGFDMFLSPAVPLTLGKSLPLVWPEIMTSEERASMAFWAVHPGGRSILDTVQSKLGLTDEEIAPSREVLRDYGNMSSATVMFVLKRFLEMGGKGPGIAMAFGPGMTIETMRFTKELQ